MNKKGLTLLTIAVAAVIGTVLAAALTMQSKTESISCSKTGPNHMVSITDGVVSPSHIVGKVCDTVKITNLDPETREIGFGKHDHHTPYNGVTEKLLRKDQSFTVTLSQKGDYAFHDHFHEETAATFTVR